MKIKTILISFFGLAIVSLLLPFTYWNAGLSGFNVSAVSPHAYTANISVLDEDGLRNAVNAAPAGTQYVIELTDDISLTANPLTIRANTDVVLTGAFSLFGDDGSDVITVNGSKLTIDGISVTHIAGETGRGVAVSSGGTLTLISGAISGNTVIGDDGGGIKLQGFFYMSGGSLSGNMAENGGGLHISHTGNNSATISDNATITGNTATSSGGGIWLHRTDLNNLKIIGNVGFSGNSASESYDRDPSYDSAYNKQISNSATWTAPFVQGYNNFDIGYSEGTPAAVYNVVFDPWNGTPTITRTVLAGGTVGTRMPPAPALVGYEFTGWRTAPDGKGQEFGKDTKVEGNITVYAYWKAVAAVLPRVFPIEEVEAKGPIHEVADPEPVQEEEPTLDKNKTKPKKSSPSEAKGEEADPVQTPYNTESFLTFNQALSPAEVLARLRAEGVPILTLGNQEVPMFSKAGLPVWAPLNLILAAVGLVLAVSAALSAIKSGRRGVDTPKRRLIPVLALGVAGIVVFILTQDMRYLSVFFNGWTVVFALFFVAEILTIRNINFKKN